MADARNSFVDAKRNETWDDKDPRGKVGAVPPAIFAFFKNVEFRSRKIVLHRGSEGTEALRLETGSENCDVTLKGRRHLLVAFASDDDGYRHYCLDFCDTSPDPAVWELGESCFAVYPTLFKLSGFLAAITLAQT